MLRKTSEGRAGMSHDHSSPDDLIVSNLGPRRIRSPLPLGTNALADEGRFVRDAARVLLDIERFPNHAAREDLLVEKAGPRQKISSTPRCKAAIVTCGGLCPGLNNVIRSVFTALRYGVPAVLGIRYGYQGLNPAKGPPPIRLTRIRGADPQPGRHGAGSVAGRRTPR